MGRRRFSADLHIRLTPKELRSWKAMARRENKTLTELIRSRLNAPAAAAATASAPPIAKKPANHDQE